MSVVTGHCFIKKFLCRETCSIEMDTHVEFYINVSINFSTINLIQKQKNKIAKMKTIDA